MLLIPTTIMQRGLVLVGVFVGLAVAFLVNYSLIIECQLSPCCVLHEPSKLLSNQSDNNNNHNNNDDKAVPPITIFKTIDERQRLVFIGVMTAQKYLDTRAKSVYATWGQLIPGKMSFFSRAGSSSAYDLPLVSLPGVDDSYPPQKKSFMMLKFMHDNYIDQFEWFMRVDDDVYIKPDKLELFLRSLNSSEPHFIGQAGLGNKQEFGMLSLDTDENFCMGGPGVLMSRRTLQMVVPNISYCLRNLYSTHEDVEVGRCVRRFANISCTWSYEMQHIFHHNASGSRAFTGDLLSRETLRAISLHPVKRHAHLYRIHAFFAMRRIIELRHERLLLARHIFQLQNELLEESQRQQRRIASNAAAEDEQYLLSNRFKMPPSVSGPVQPTRGNKQQQRRRRRHKRHDFDFFTRSLFSPAYVSPKRGLEGYWRRALVDTLRQLMESVNAHSLERGRLIDFKELLYGYMRHQPLLGVDYILDAQLVYRKYQGRKMTVPVRRHAYVRHTFASLEFRADDDDDDKHQKKVHLQIDEVEALQVRGDVADKVVCIVLPLKGRAHIFGRFMANYERVVLSDASERRRVRLAIVLFEEEEKGQSSRQEHVELTLANLAHKYGVRAHYDEHAAMASGDDWSLAVVRVNNASFSRSIGCETGAALFAPHDLLMFMDVDMAFDAAFLLRTRLNTVRHRQVYYPIVFSEYGEAHDLLDMLDESRAARRNASRVVRPRQEEEEKKKKKEKTSFGADQGYWRQFGFGLVAVYNSDLRSVGGFDTSIVGWGMEDVDLYEKFIRSPHHLTIFRSVDPGLVHVYHRIECAADLPVEQMIMCLGSKWTSLASQRTLARLIYVNATTRTPIEH